MENKRKIRGDGEGQHADRPPERAEFPRNIDNFRMYRYTQSIYDHERKAMSDEESDSTGDHNPNRMTGSFLKHIICLC